MFKGKQEKRKVGTVVERRMYQLEFARYALINVIAMIGLSCYILADTFFISKGLGANGLTALNLAIPVYSFISGTGLMLGMGGATKYTIFNAQKERALSHKIFTTTIFIAIIISIIYVFIGILFSEIITKILGANKEVFEMTNTYLKVALLFSPAFIINNVLICFIRNDNHPSLAMVASLTGSFSNIILDYIFIFPLNMGMFGAVFATGLAPVISMLVMLPHLIRGKQGFRLSLSLPDKTMLRNIFQLGFPSLVVEISTGIVIIVFNRIILGIAGNEGVAAYGVVANISIVVIAVFTGMAQGMQPITSKAYGSGNMQMAKHILKIALSGAMIMAVAIYGILFVFADPVTSIFNSQGNPILQEIAALGLKLYFIGMIFAGGNVVMSMFFTSIEKVIPAHTITLSRGIIVIIPIAFILSKMFGLIGTWLAFPVTEMTVFLIGILFWVKLKATHTIEKEC